MDVEGGLSDMIRFSMDDYRRMLNGALRPYRIAHQFQAGLGTVTQVRDVFVDTIGADPIWLAAYIELAPGEDAADIDLDQVHLGYIAGNKLNVPIPAANDPNLPWVQNRQTADTDGDAVAELLVKFPLAAVLAALGAPPCDPVSVTTCWIGVTGDNHEGTAFADPLDSDGDGTPDACEPGQILTWRSLRMQGSGEYALTLDATDGHAVSEARRAGTNVADSGILRVLVDFDQPVQPSDGVLDPTDVSVRDHNGATFLPDGIALTNGVSRLVITFNVGNLPNLRRYTFDLAGKFQNAAGVSLGGDTTCDIRALVADVDSSGVVNNTDVQAVKVRIGQPLSDATAKYDLNVSGTITTTDQALAKSRVGNSAP
jgi:hypothetical protein